MQPIFFSIGPLTVRLYGAALAVGFIVAILLGVRSARRQAFSVARLLDICFLILIFSILGSRLLFVITEARTYAALCVGKASDLERQLSQILLDCSRPLWLWEGGVVYYGGLISAMLTSYWYCRRHGLRFFRLADLSAPLIALGHFFGRLGCLSAGCCYGKTTSFWFGIRFPPASVAYQEMVRDGLLGPGFSWTPPLIPTQLLEAGAELAIFFVLLWQGRRKAFHGQVLLMYLLCYGGARFLLEFFRADPDRHFLIALYTPRLNRLLGLDPLALSLISTSQAIGLIFFLGSLLMLVRYRRRARA
jgi:phosphatidylglycerol---prolipoprotein diacylglyceryl transferase